MTSTEGSNIGGTPGESPKFEFLSYRSFRESTDCQKFEIRGGELWWKKRPEGIKSFTMRVGESTTFVLGFLIGVRDGKYSMK